MKFSFHLDQRRAMDRSTAWACFLANQFSLPGIGSLAAGRRSGYAQLILSGIGILPTLAFSLRLLVALFGFHQTSGSFGSLDELIDSLQVHLREWPQRWGLYFWIGAPGVALFLAG